MIGWGIALMMKYPVYLYTGYLYSYLVSFSFNSFLTTHILFVSVHSNLQYFWLPACFPFPSICSFISLPSLPPSPSLNSLVNSLNPFFFQPIWRSSTAVSSSATLRSARLRSRSWARRSTTRLWRESPLPRRSTSSKRSNSKTRTRRSASTVLKVGF